MIIMKEHKIGEEFTYKGIKLKVVEDNSRPPCTICYFKGKDCSDKVLDCFEWDRIDNKKVHFEQVNKGL